MVTKTQKTAQNDADTTGSDVVVSGGFNPPAHFAGFLDDDAGLGTSSAAEDNIVPLVSVLQGLSPQLKPRDPAYVEGAASGDFFLKGALSPVVPGEGGMVVVPCAFQKAWVEWVPRERGGGYVGQHLERPADAREVKDPKDPSRTKWVRGDNELIETRYHYILVAMPGQGLMPYVLPFSSTGHTTSREWMMMMNAYKFPPKSKHAGKALPSFHRRYHLTTVSKKNTKGEWNAIRVEPLGEVQSEEEYLAGRALALSVSTGAMVADAPDQQGGDVGVGAGAEQHI